MKYLIIIYSFLLLTSCLKRDETKVNTACTDSCTTFNVYVGTETNSAKPVKDAQVELSWSKPGNSTPFGDPGRLISSGKTGANGTLSFSFKPLKKELLSGSFSVSIKNNPDGFSSYKRYYDISSFDTLVSARIHLPTKATVKMVLKNFKPTQKEDYFSVSPHYEIYDTDGLVLSYYEINGKPFNSINTGNDPPFTKLELIGTTAGNQFTYFNIAKNKNGIRENNMDSVYVRNGETKVLEMEY
jgi:hypothetical protein